MKSKYFLAIFLPCLIIVVIYTSFSAIYQRQNALRITKITVRKAFTLFKNDSEFIVQNYDDYETEMKLKVSEFHFGSMYYAWLMKNDGTTLAISSYKKELEPSIEETNRSLFLQHIKTNQPAGFWGTSTSEYQKFIEYGTIPNTDLVIAVLADIPNNFIPSHSFISKYTIVTLILIILSAIWAFRFNAKISKDKNKLLTYGSVLFQGTDMERPKFKDKSLDSIAYFIEGLYKKPILEVWHNTNSITFLPNTNALEGKLFTCIDAKKPFAVCEILIHNYYAYQSRYGKNKSQAMLRSVATILRNSVQEYGTDNDLIAQVDNNRFVIVTVPLRASDIAKEIIKQYERQLQFYYDEADFEKGYILSKNESGDIGSYPLNTILIGIATNNNIPLLHPLQIAHITNELIEYLSKKSESGYIIDRRNIDRTPYPPKTGEETAEIKEEKKEENYKIEQIPLETRKLTESDKNRIKNNKHKKRDRGKNYYQILKESAKKVNQ